MSYKNYESKPQFLSKGVVLCQPGLWCSADTYTPMWNTLNKIANKTTIDLSSKVLMSTNINNEEIINELNSKKGNGKITFFKTLFTNVIGRVDDQADELYKIIIKIKSVFGEDIPIFLVGYSKGGLVNMRFATKYQGIATNITSIGTPYHNSFLQKVLSILDDIVKNVSIMSVDGVKQLIDLAYKKLDECVSDEDLGSDAFFTKLKTEWSRVTKKPYITCIICSQIGFTSNSYGGSDLVVDASAQRADGFSNINERILIDDNYEYLVRENWWDYLYMCTSVHALEILENVTWGIAEAISRGDFLYALLAFSLALIPYTWDIGKYDLIHTQELINQNVCKAVLSAINKSNPNISGGYYNG